MGLVLLQVELLAFLIGYIDRETEITVKLLGGELKIKWDDDVYMTGAARTVFEGQFENL